MRQLWAIAAALFLAVSAPSAQTEAAESYPERPVRFIVPWSAGGVTDIVARLVADKLGPELGGTVVVENRPGASGVIGTEYVKRADPDGYTLLVITSSTHALTPQLFTGVPYDPVNDFDQVSQLTAAPTILVAPPTLDADTAEEFVEMAKDRPGEFTYASFGEGSSAHLAAELFQLETGIELHHVPYPGAAPALADMMGGQVDLHLFFDSIPSALPYVRDGRLKALAVTGPQPSSAAPDVPALAETYPGFQLTVWQGIGAPVGTPEGVIEKLRGALERVMAMPDVQKQLRELGSEALSTTPKEFREHIAQQNEMWDSLIEQIGLERQQWAN